MIGLSERSCRDSSDDLRMTIADILEMGNGRLPIPSIARINRQAALLFC